MCLYRHSSKFSCGLRIESSDHRLDAVQQHLEVAAEQNYLVVYKLPITPLTPEADVKRAGGTLLASYPFGVVVAKSSDAKFAANMLVQNPLSVDSVAATGGRPVDTVGSTLAYNPF